MTGANTNDSLMFEALDDIPAVRTPAGRGRRPTEACTVTLIPGSRLSLSEERIVACPADRRSQSPTSPEIRMVHDRARASARRPRPGAVRPLAYPRAGGQPARPPGSEPPTHVRRLAVVGRAAARWPAVGAADGPGPARPLPARVPVPGPGRTPADARRRAGGRGRQPPGRGAGRARHGLGASAVAVGAAAPLRGPGRAPARRRRGAAALLGGRRPAGVAAAAGGLRPGPDLPHGAVRRRRPGPGPGRPASRAGHGGRPAPNRQAASLPPVLRPGRGGDRGGAMRLCLAVPAGGLLRRRPTRACLSSSGGGGVVGGAVGRAHRPADGPGRADPGRAAGYP